MFLSFLYHKLKFKEWLNLEEEQRLFPKNDVIINKKYVFLGIPMLATYFSDGMYNQL